MSEERERCEAASFFRSYAGMTRIRFKGPAHRRLSAAWRSPRNGVKMRELDFIVKTSRDHGRNGEKTGIGNKFPPHGPVPAASAVLWSRVIKPGASRLRPRQNTRTDGRKFRQALKNPEHPLLEVSL